jgi:putative ABC transport system permease protein
MFLETVRLAFRSIRRNALRSFLTLLGIVIGVAAVIAMITIGSGTTQKVQSDIAKLGSNLLVLRPGAPAQPGTPPSAVVRPFKDRTLSILSHDLVGAKAISGASQQSVTAVYGTESLSTAVTGTDPDYLTARDWTIAAGRSFTDAETRGGAPVCIIGETVRQQFFGAGDPIGQRIRVSKIPCLVIGLLDAKGYSGFGSDQDNVVFMPLATFQRRIAGNNNIDTIFISAASGVSTASLQTSIEDIMREIRHIRPGTQDDFSVRDMTQIAQTMASATSVMTGMLGAVAAVSLLVGGIGIMNIMLVSVTERTREIGIRLAIGAHERHILTQFLVEATVLSLLGGIAGVALGLGLAVLASIFMAVPFIPSLPVILLAVGFSGLIGIIFGFFPALNGARLDPIEALRHE